MGLSYSHSISVLELIVYFPALFLSLYLVWRHGIRRNSGFLFLHTFAMLRIVGACCDLAAISDPSTGLYQATAICSSIGLSPLVLACSGLLSRADNSIQRRNGNPIGSKIFVLIRLLTLAGLVLSIVALSNDMSVEALEHPDIKIKIAMVIYIVSWVALVIALALLFHRRSQIEKEERRVLLAVGLSAVFILIRLIYSLLVWFLADSTFNLLSGNETAKLMMSVLEEFAVVIICLSVGMTLPVRGPVEETKARGMPTQESDRVRNW